MFQNLVKTLEINSEKAIFKMIPLTDLKIDTSYQRDVTNRGLVLIKSIINSFNPGALGALTVSERTDGYYVIDGQHRLYALRSLKYPMAMCQVLKNLTVKEEAEIFRILNIDKKMLLSNDAFKAALIAKEPWALDILQIVEEAGLTLVLNNSRAKNAICAVSAVQNIYKKINGKSLLRRTLHLINGAWTDEKAALESTILNGMTIFLEMYGGDFEDREFIKKMRTAPIQKIHKKTSAYIMAFGGNAKTNCAKAIWDAYNHNRHNKLQNKFI